MTGPIDNPAAGESALPAVFRPQLTAALTPAAPSFVILPANVPTIIARPNAARVSLVILRSPLSNGLLAVSPFEDPMVAGIRIDGPGGFASISQDVWFSLTQYGWWGTSANGETILVYDLARRF